MLRYVEKVRREYGNVLTVESETRKLKESFKKVFRKRSKSVENMLSI